jgi:hypothetical protein
MGQHLQGHPRLAQLRRDVLGLPVDEDYRAALLQSIETYAEEIIIDPVHAPGEGWDDLEALQQATLADMMALWMDKAHEART